MRPIDRLIEGVQNRSLWQVAGLYAAAAFMAAAVVGLFEAAGGVAEAYPNPRPRPVRTPNPSIQALRALDWEIPISPPPVRIPPMIAVTRGLSLSWSRPAKIIATLSTSRRSYLLNQGIEEGEKVRIPWFDPLSLTGKKSTVEYMGRDKQLIKGKIYNVISITR